MSVARYAASDDSHRPVAQMNITPLVDVMLVLLVIFMMAVPVVARPLQVALPRGDSAAPPPPRATLQVTSAGGFVLDGQTVEREALASALAALNERDRRTVLRIEASEDGDYQAFATALSTAQASGLGNIAL